MSREGYVSDFDAEEADGLRAPGCRCSIQQLELVGCDCDRSDAVEVDRLAAAMLDDYDRQAGVYVQAAVVAGGSEAAMTFAIFTPEELTVQFIDRAVGAISAAENLTDDRRKLTLVGTAEAIAMLKAQPGARSLWLDPPACFEGHPSIRGSFAGVPVAEMPMPGMGVRTVCVMLGQRLVAVVGDS